MQNPLAHGVSDESLKLLELGTFGIPNEEGTSPDCERWGPVGEFLGLIAR
jgi:hypothetical protein